MSRYCLQALYVRLLLVVPKSACVTTALLATSRTLTVRAACSPEVQSAANVKTAIRFMDLPSLRRHSRHAERGGQGTAGASRRRSFDPDEKVGVLSRSDVETLEPAH